MIFLTNEQILDFMKNCVCFTYRKNGKEGELCCDIDFSDDEIEMGAYQAILEGDILFETGDYDEMLAFLNANDFELESMNGFDSLQAFQEDKEFQQMEMKALLEKYGDCDTFSLCALYGESYLSKQEGERAYLEMVEENRAYLEELYSHFQEYGLEDFETLYKNIAAECQAYKQKHETKKNFCCSFISDKVGDGTKYGEPTEFFWHFYHALGMDLDNLREVERLEKLPENFSPTDVLNEKEYLALKPYLLRCHISFKTHCTVCGNMQKELFFTLNDQTKAWLLQRKNDYDFEGELQDLALYKDGKLRFSSCTHEGYHDDIQIEE